MTNAIESAATMYTINSIVNLIIAAALIGYIAIGTIRLMVEERKFRRQFNQSKKGSK